MTKQELDAEKERLLDVVRESINQHRSAIRWLSEVEKFYLTYSGDGWKGERSSALAEIARKDFEEAQQLVITSRGNLESSKEELAKFNRKYTR